GFDEPAPDGRRAFRFDAFPHARVEARPRLRFRAQVPQQQSLLPHGFHFAAALRTVSQVFLVLSGSAVTRASEHFFQVILNRAMHDVLPSVHCLASRVCMPAVIACLLTCRTDARGSTAGPLSPAFAGCETASL